MIPLAVVVLFSVSTFILGFEAGKNVGYNQARTAIVEAIKAVISMNEKEKTNE